MDSDARSEGGSSSVSFGEKSNPRYYWHADQYDPAMASIRLRLWQPISYLQSVGVMIDTAGHGFDSSIHDGIIFSKSYGLSALEMAQCAKRAGKPIIYDLCDNVFAGKASRKARIRASRIREIMSIADYCVFTTAQLRDQILDEVGFPIDRSIIIPDMLERFTDCEEADGGTAGHDLSRLKYFLQKNEGALRCVWFGKSQGTKAGMVHLKKALIALAEFSHRHPVTLTIISNKPLLYRMLSWRWPIPHCYMQWDQSTFHYALSMHDVALIPIEQNSYTIGKTINRPATAIMAGLGVVADALPAYEELRPYIWLDTWREGLEYYRRCNIPMDPALKLARQHLEDSYCVSRLGEMWLNIMSKAISRE